jgi:hypothetical protein
VSAQDACQAVLRERLERLLGDLERAPKEAQEGARGQRRAGIDVNEGAFVGGWLEQTCKNAAAELRQLLALLGLSLCRALPRQLRARPVVEGPDVAGELEVAGDLMHVHRGPAPLARHLVEIHVHTLASNLHLTKQVRGSVVHAGHCRTALVALLALALLVAGCGGSQPGAASEGVRVAGPAAADQERALKLVWEGVYGMHRAQRPRITWWQACPDGHENEGCYDEYTTPGDVNLIWVGAIPELGIDAPGTLISATHFSEALEADWEWLTFPPGQLATSARASQLTHVAQGALRAAGL